MLLSNSNNPSPVTSSTNLGVLHSGNHIGKDVLLSKIGGKKVLHQAVDDFYDRLIKDPNIKPFFENSNVQVLKWHQYNLMSIAFHNVPVDFDIATLILQKHTNMFDAGLDGKTFDIVIIHFTETLRNLHVPEDTILEALELVKPLRLIFENGAKEAARKKLLAARQRRMFQIIAAGSALAVCVWINMRRNKGDSKQTGKTA